MKVTDQQRWDEAADEGGAGKELGNTTAHRLAWQSGSQGGNVPRLRRGSGTRRNRLPDLGLCLGSRRSTLICTVGGWSRPGRAAQESAQPAPGCSGLDRCTQKRPRQVSGVNQSTRPKAVTAKGFLVFQIPSSQMSYWRHVSLIFLGSLNRVLAQFGSHLLKGGSSGSQGMAAGRVLERPSALTRVIFLVK